MKSLISIIIGISVVIKIRPLGIIWSFTCII